MGGSYSDLNVYFCSKKGGYDGIGYKVKTTLENYKECSNFIVLIHKIEFGKGINSSNYNILLNDGSSDKYKGSRVFGYYYPGNDNEVIQQVSAYFSVLAPNVPLVVSFKTPLHEYICSFSDLKNARWDYGYNITGYTIKKPLKNQLDEEFKKLRLNRKIRFRIGSEKEEISCYKQELDHQKKFRLVFLPRDKEPVLGSDYLFAIDFVKNEPKIPGEPSIGREKFCEIAIEKELRKKVKETGVCNSAEKKETCEKLIKKYVKLKHTLPNVNRKNQIDEYFLRPYKGKLYDGIMVYLVREDKKPPETLCDDKDDLCSPLLLEFIDSCKSKTYLKRKDKQGYWWSQEKFEYKDDETLTIALKSIEIGGQDVVTVILDKKENYLGATVTPNRNKNTYNKYTHEFTKPNTPITLFARQKRIDSLTKSIKAQNVEVYYLKTKRIEDKEPFLIVFDPDGKEQKKKKACHFKGNYWFKDWVEFKFDFKKTDQEKPGFDREKELVEKLYKKLDKIEEYGRCISDLKLLRSHAYDILMNKEPKPPDKKEEQPPQRPEEKPPPTQDEGLDLPLIVGGSVGGGVFVVSSAVGYGVYWYNTTIKLLT
ncbi:hypothetical protein MACJ_002416 [Theileria orientalis]|uniref:Uncharacterized protein n=1 Tax=Theileria orientalis TaxID=68886 RepID=A0A976QSN5_THEOR|nr:hypothetical protein MACJ_002416 [Theileria orientalis]